MAEPKGNTETLVVSNASDKQEEKYALRPRSAIKKHKVEQYQPDYIPKRPKRPKPKSTTISKYRRKTANARERHRMKVINTAFESLRKVLPDGVELCASSSAMTKITTLRLAVKYIRSLSDMLDDDASDGGNTPEGGQVKVEQEMSSVVEPPINYTLPQPVSQFPNKNILRCSRPSSMSYIQPSSYYFTSQTHFTNSLSKHYAFSPTSTSSVRGSLSSTSDLEELLSDDSEFLDDNFDVFSDIPSMASNDPFEVLLETEKNCPAFAST